MMDNTSGNQRIGFPISGLKLSRRQLMQQAAFSGLLLACPWVNRAFADFPDLIQNSFRKNTTGDGFVGPFGEVRIYNAGGQVLPIVVINNDAEMNFTGRIPFVRFGRAGDSTAITLTGFGVQYGAARPMQWSTGVINEMIKTIVANRNKVSGVMQLRSALHTSYPVANMALLPQNTMGKQMAAVISRSAVGLGAGAMNTSTTNCNIMTATETAIKTITETVKVILPALQQYQACYDSHITKDKLRPAGTFAEAREAGICRGKPFIDIVTGTITMVTNIAEVITREVIVCKAAPVNTWPNPWDHTGPFNTYREGVIPQLQQVIDVAGALNFLRPILAGFGPFAQLLLNGKWSIAQLGVPLNIMGKTVLPYTVKVCIGLDSAKRYDPRVIDPAKDGSWPFLVRVLAGLDNDFAQVVARARLGIPPATNLPTAAPAVITGAKIILTFIALALWHSIAIRPQFSFQVCCADHLGDGLICIEHPTLALALLSIPLLDFRPSTPIVPPIVTG
jgi:hypothetical protein